MVPELTCASLQDSLAFYLGVLGFTTCYQRDGFAYLNIGEAQLMLEQGPSDWIAGPLDRPYGRGVNLQIEVESVGPMIKRLADEGHQLFMGVRDQWYRANELEHGQREFIVQDPDGYLLRFCEVLGERSAST